MSVIIVAYNSADDLSELLPLLNDPRLEVLVIDNASPDKCVEVVQRHAWCTSVEMGVNAGWTAASNEGARRSSAPVLAFVNPDVRVDADALLALSGHLGPGVASVSPTFVDAAGRPYAFAFRFPGPIDGLFTFFNAGQRIDALLGHHFARRRTYDGCSDSKGVDHIGAACLVAERAVFEESGAFDERMWLFFSDTDWALRMRKRGRRSISVAGLSVFHEGGGSVGHLPARRLATILQRDYVRYADVHYGAWGRELTRLGVVLLVGLMPALASLARGDARSAAACMRQARDVLR